MNLPKESFFTSLILLSQFDFFAKRILLSQSMYRLANLIRLSHFLASLIRLSHFLANLILLSQPFLANRIRLSHGLLFLTNLILLSQTPLLSISSSSSEKDKKSYEVKLSSCSHHGFTNPESQKMHTYFNVHMLI